MSGFEVYDVGSDKIILFRCHLQIHGDLNLRNVRAYSIWLMQCWKASVLALTID